MTHVEKTHGLVWKWGIPFDPLAIGGLYPIYRWTHSDHMIAEKHEKHLSPSFSPLLAKSTHFSVFSTFSPSLSYFFSIFSNKYYHYITTVFYKWHFFTANDWGKLPWLEEGDEGAKVSRNFRIQWGFHGVWIKKNYGFLGFHGDLMVYMGFDGGLMGFFTNHSYLAVSKWCSIPSK